MRIQNWTVTFPCGRSAAIKPERLNAAYRTKVHCRMDHHLKPQLAAKLILKELLLLHLRWSCRSRFFFAFVAQKCRWEFAAKNVDVKEEKY
ncbi:hypothetical protein KFK09_002172 [Dendrobium nobile]|uniref:Uncharacterized protein n=1 Tax=Dendrobium nobile TaxID=94219 RepID=A0A8T3C9H3_DENNO|nr:hypothetical protein KFK09_002172 [Dendrobium nobile]